MKNQLALTDDSDPVNRWQSLALHPVVSLFSGCGGLDLGFRGGFDFNGANYRPLPFRVIWANDLNAAACRTYRANLGHEIRCGDIWDEFRALPESCDVVIGGFPCQDVSINGKQLAGDGVRSTLYTAMIAAITLLRPKVFVAENVKGLLMSHSDAFYRTMISEFRQIGYEVDVHLYQAADFGVPQTRERVFIVGASDLSTFERPAPIITNGQRVTAGQILGDLEGVDEDRASSHVWSRAKASPEQGSRRLRQNEPATTIRAECHGNSQYHYRLKRRISMREAARIQSFPDWFTFHAGLRETERMVGNAAPPVLAWHIAKAVAGMLQ